MKGFAPCSGTLHQVNNGAEYRYDHKSGHPMLFDVVVIDSDLANHLTSPLPKVMTACG
jgi:hypothetical protein